MGGGSAVNNFFAGFVKQKIVFDSPELLATASLGITNITGIKPTSNSKCSFRIYDLGFNSSDATANANANAHCDCNDGDCDGSDSDCGGIDDYIQAVSDDSTAGSHPEASTVSMRKTWMLKGTRADRGQPVKPKKR